jgi:hypothetical protein
MEFLGLLAPLSRTRAQAAAWPGKPASQQGNSLLSEFAESPFDASSRRHGLQRTRTFILLPRLKLSGLFVDRWTAALILYEILANACLAYQDPFVGLKVLPTKDLSTRKV